MNEESFASGAHSVQLAIRAALDAGEHVVADVEYRGWTPAGELRHAVFKGWQR